MGRSHRRSVSLYPFDPASRYFTPPAFQSAGEAVNPDTGGVERVDFPG
jgi:hypothetical protein